MLVLLIDTGMEWTQLSISSDLVESGDLEDCVHSIPMLTNLTNNMRMTISAFS